MAPEVAASSEYFWTQEKSTTQIHKSNNIKEIISIYNNWETAVQTNLFVDETGCSYQVATQF